jgi:hypothetical protein
MVSGELARDDCLQRKGSYETLWSGLPAVCNSSPFHSTSPSVKWSRGQARSSRTAQAGSRERLGRPPVKEQPDFLARTTPRYRDVLRLCLTDLNFPATRPPCPGAIHPVAICSVTPFPGAYCAGLRTGRPAQPTRGRPFVCQPKISVLRSSQLGLTVWSRFPHRLSSDCNAP